MRFPRLSKGQHIATFPAASRGLAAFRIRPELMQAFARCWIAAAGVFYLADLWRQTRVGWTNGADRPFGDDFLNYWSGAVLAWRQSPAQIYDWRAYHAFQESLVGAPLDFYHYSYPPVLLLLTAPLAVLPYVPALGAWLVASWFAFYRALRLALPRGGALVFSLATPALFVNALGGQNGAWTAALFGGGLCLLERRPLVAGALLGLLAYKPHLAILLPVALVAGRQWRALVAAGVSAGSLIALSVWIFGLDIWSDYFRNVAILRETVLEDGTGVWHRMVSVFVFARRLGADVAAAYAIQLAVALSAAVIVARAWFREGALPTKNALLILGTCLATPYLQDYDLVAGAFVVAWLLLRGDSPHALRAPALIASALVLLLPIVAAPFAHATGLALGPLFIMPAFVVAACWSGMALTPVENPQSGPLRLAKTALARAMTRSPQRK